jgi:hypothetical protein
VEASPEPPSDLDSHEVVTEIIWPDEEFQTYEDATMRWARVLGRALPLLLLMCVCLVGVAALVYGIGFFDDSSETQDAVALWQQGLAMQAALTVKETEAPEEEGSEAVEAESGMEATLAPSSSASTSSSHTPDGEDRAQPTATTDSILPEGYPHDIDAAIAFHSYDASGGSAVFLVTNTSDGAALESATVHIMNRDTDVHYYGPLHSDIPFRSEPVSGTSESSLAPGVTRYMRYKLSGHPGGVPCRATFTLHTSEGGSGANVTKTVDFEVAAQAASAVTMVGVQPRQLQSGSCATIPGENYRQTWIIPPPTDRPAETHPDLNLSIRGYAPTNARKDFVFYRGGTDEMAVQLSGLFGDDRPASISSVYRVYDWDWTSHRRGGLLSDPDVTLMGLAVSPGDIIRLPPSGRTIGEGYHALVLYADSTSLTIKYTREDTVVSGYTIHLGNICPEPRLLALYQNCNASGRLRLPALRNGHALGRASGSELLVAIRDNGDFMDPRSGKEWWSR